MNQLQVYLKVVVDMEDRDERPEAVARELARIVERAYGVKRVEVSNVVED
jgi:hypothetical protein